MQKLKFKLPDSKFWFVVVIFALSFVGIFDHDLWTSDEPRVAEIGREFLDDGASLAVPRLGGEPFLEKPPLYFWCVVLSYKIFGGPSASAARIPSVFFGLGTIVFTYLLARSMYCRNTAIWSCMVLALSTEYFAITHKSLVDISLVFFATGTVYWLYLGINSQEQKKGIYYTICYIFATWAFFAKGFIGLAFPALLFICWILWTKDWYEIKRARLWVGFLIVGTGISLWFLALWKEGSWGYLGTFLVHNHMQRFMPGVGYSGGHIKPFYYYLSAFWGGFAPWSILTPAVFFYVYRKGFQDTNSFFLVLWFMSGFLMLSLAGTKRTIYLVPLFPSISILTGSWFNDTENRMANAMIDRISQWFIVCVCGVSIVLLIGSAFRYELFKPSLFILSITLIIYYIVVFRSFIKYIIIKLCGLPILISLIYISYVLIFHPYINEKKTLKQFCNKLVEISALKEKTIYAFQPDETTEAMVPFYTGSYVTPVYELEKIKSMGRNEDMLVLVVDERDNRPLYNSLNDTFHNVLISGQSSRRHMVLLSNEGK